MVKRKLGSYSVSLGRLLRSWVEEPLITAYMASLRRRLMSGSMLMVGKVRL